MAHLRGRMRKGTRITTGCYVLVSLRDFQDEKCDIIHKYNDDEVRLLESAGHLRIDSEQNQFDASNEEVKIEFMHESVSLNEINIDKI